MPDSASVRNRLLGAIAALLLVAGLRWSYPVSMPLAAAVFVVAAAWPIKPWLDRRLPPILAYAGTILALLLVFAAFLGAAYLAAAQVVQTFAERQDQFGQLYDDYRRWAGANGLPPPPSGASGLERLSSVAAAAAAGLYDVLAYLGLVAVLVLLGLPEVPAMRRKIRDRLHAINREEVFDAADEIARAFRAYIGVTLLASLVTGLASAAWAWAVGLDLALTWGVLNFLLNFVPVIGNVVGILPPTLYAAVQFGGWTMPLVVFLGYAALQIGISNFLYPWLQGERLSLSPAAVVVSLAFWGWVWGAAGALLAVPLTAAVTIACARFQSTAWVAKLLSKG